MVFNTIETSTESGQPIELYEFTIGTTTTRLTSSENDVLLTSTSKTYTATNLQRSGLATETNSSTSNRLTVTMPAEHDFVVQFRTIPPGQRAFLTIQRLHRDDLGGSEDRITIFKGTIRNISYTNNCREAVLYLLPLTSAFSRHIPRRTYQSLCPHMLYSPSPACTLSKDDPLFRYFGTVSAVNGDVITVTGAGSFSGLADFFEAGYVEFNNDHRDIEAQSGDDLTLIVPFLISPLGSTVICRAGCKHRHITDCKNKFSNQFNYGGFPYVPKKNPFETGLD